MEARKLYTLGTDRRSEEDFIEILCSYDIEAVIDVRRFPISKFEQFKKTYLETFLKDAGIEYYYLGKELGGYRKGGYETYSLTDEFKAGISLTEEIAMGRPSVVICAERFPWKCHRRYIARAMHKKGWEVIHIIDKGKIWIPKP